MKTETCSVVTAPPATSVHLFVTQSSNRPARIETMTGRRIATMADDPTDQRAAKAFALLFAAAPDMIAALRVAESFMENVNSLLPTPEGAKGLRIVKAAITKATL